MLGRLAYRTRTEHSESPTLRGESGERYKNTRMPCGHSTITPPKKESPDLKRTHYTKAHHLLWCWCPQMERDERDPREMDASDVRADRRRHSVRATWLWLEGAIIIDAQPKPAYLSASSEESVGIDSAEGGGEVQFA